MLKTTTAGLTVLAASAMLALAACGQDAGVTGDAGDAAPGATSDDSGSAAARDAAPDVAAEAIDPTHYFGLYGDADNPDAVRGMMFVTEAKPPPMADHFPEIPEGYIMISAAWADVAPYYMKPVSPTRFEQDWLSDFQPEPLIANFELDMDGNAVAVTFETVLDEFGRRARLGDVPAEYR